MAPPPPISFWRTPASRPRASPRNRALDAALPGRRGRPTIPKACFGLGERCTARSGRTISSSAITSTSRDFPSSTVVVDRSRPCAPHPVVRSQRTRSRHRIARPSLFPSLAGSDLVQIELDRCGGFCRFHIRSLDRPQNFDHAPAALHPAGELGGGVFLARAAGHSGKI